MEGDGTKNFCLKQPSKYSIKQYQSKQSEKQVEENIDKFVYLLNHYTNVKKEFKTNMISTVTYLEEKQILNSPIPKFQLEKIQQSLNQGRQILRFQDTRDMIIASSSVSANQNQNLQSKTNIPKQLTEGQFQYTQKNISQKEPFLQSKFVHQDNGRNRSYDLDQAVLSGLVSKQKSVHTGSGYFSLQNQIQQTQEIGAKEEDQLVFKNQIKSQNLGKKNKSHKDQKKLKVDYLQIENGVEKVIKQKKAQFTSGNLKFNYKIQLNNLIDYCKESICSFCGISGQQQSNNQMGPLLMLDQVSKIFAHYLCIIPAIQNDHNIKNFEGTKVLNYYKNAVQQVNIHQIQQQCFFCKSFGATHQCAQVDANEIRTCNLFFHFFCFFTRQTNPQFVPKKVSLYCGYSNHKPKIYAKYPKRIKDDQLDKCQKSLKLSKISKHSITSGQCPQKSIVIQLLQEVPIKSAQFNQFETKLEDSEIINSQSNNKIQDNQCLKTSQETIIFQNRQEKIQNTKEQHKVSVKPDLLKQFHHIKSCSYQLKQNFSFQDYMTLENNPESLQVDTKKYQSNSLTKEEVDEFIKSLKQNSTKEGPRFFPQ